MLITVTLADITYGVRGNPSYCPIARAVRRESGYKKSTVGCDTIKLRDKNMTGRGQGIPYLMPDSAIEFRRLFDHNLPVEPFEFDLLEELPRGI
jgi:hypothetical protein